MSSSDDPQSKPAKPAHSADDALPPVEAPGAGFVLQLFFIPMIIVAIIVLVWLLFSWLAHMGNDPQALLNDMQKLNNASWQKALTFTNMLRDPQHEELKHDQSLARQTAALLESEVEEGNLSRERLQLRIFLCRALGEFHTDAGLPALLEAASTERNRKELAVRASALEGLGSLVGNVGPEKLRENERLLDVLLEASRERGSETPQAAGADDSGPTRLDAFLRRDDLRSHAAFVLGALGGERALERLRVMLHDAYPNARYNAATGLAAHGDLAARPVVIEMLDPDNPEAVRNEMADTGRQAKRVMVLRSGIRAAVELSRTNPSADLDQLQDGLKRLSRREDLPRGVQLEAEEALRLMSAIDGLRAGA